MRHSHLPLVLIGVASLLPGTVSQSMATQTNMVLMTYSFEVFEFEDYYGTTPDPFAGVEFRLDIFEGTGGEALLQVTNVSDPSSPNVSFTQPTITRIYLDDDLGTLGDGFVYDTTGTSAGEGVEMTFDARPRNVPGGNNINFFAEVSVGAVAPPSKTGIDPFEAVTLGFDTSSVDTVIAGLNSGDLRMALHVQEIGPCGEKSASFVNLVPEPSSAMLLFFAGALATGRRRRMRGANL